MLIQRHLNTATAGWSLHLLHRAFPQRAWPFVNLILGVFLVFFPHLSIWLSISLPVCLSACLFVCLYVYFSVCLSACLFVCLYIFLSVVLFICLSIVFPLYLSLSIYLFFCLSLSTYLSILLFIHLSTYLSISHTPPYPYPCLSHSHLSLIPPPSAIYPSILPSINLPIYPSPSPPVFLASLLHTSIHSTSFRFIAQFFAQLLPVYSKPRPCPRIFRCLLTVFSSYSLVS